MIKLPGMLMIGSAGSNIGKTELACAILRKFAQAREIIGIKVTTIANKNGTCPRTGKGCGVCSSLEGVFCITEETGTDSAKDTGRLLAAGARRVFWLRVLAENLSDGLTALLKVIGPDVICVCESNSLRRVVEPGLFLMVSPQDSPTWKDQARQVRQYADKIVVSDGKGFDLDLDLIELTDGKWRIRKHLDKATAIILAGGAGSRMGVDKSMLPLDGKPMIEKICDQLRGRFDQILISANEPEKFRSLGLRVVPDRIRGQGPLMGIASALEASRNELNFVVACDIPRINIHCVEAMLAEASKNSADIVVPKKDGEQHEPLFAVYCRSAIDAINKALSSGKRRIRDAFDLCRVKYVELGDAEWLTNLNTMAEYEQFRDKHGD